MPIPRLHPDPRQDRVPDFDASIGLALVQVTGVVLRYASYEREIKGTIAATCRRTGSACLIMPDTCPGQPTTQRLAYSGPGRSRYPKAEDPPQTGQLDDTSFS